MSSVLERVLLLGCIAILLLELPGVIADWRFGDGFAQVEQAQRASDALAASEVEGADTTSAVFAALLEEAAAPVELAAVPGL